MSKKIVIDTEAIKKAVDSLKKLKTDCIQERKKIIKLVEKSDISNVHNELDEACSVIDNVWTEFIKLIDKSIDFLSDAGNAYDISDRESAKNIES